MKPEVVCIQRRRNIDDLHNKHAALKMIIFRKNRHCPVLGMDTNVTSGENSLCTDNLL